ncbi:staphopain A [Enterococcus sp. DIV2384]|uniref:C47 family peptidase n=1 Tax=Enterococcus sp. DIV2384 TaxID=2774846 RepID=UPI00372C2495
MRAKKIFGGMILFVLSMLVGIPAFAAESNTSSLYIQTEAVNQELTAQAQKNWKFYFENLSIMENTDSLNVDEFYLGQPFLLTNEVIYEDAFFPIINKQTGTIANLLEISMINSKPSITISSQFVEQLNNLTTTSEGSCFSLKVDNDTQQLVIEKQAYNDQSVNIMQTAKESTRQKRSVPDDIVPEYTRKVIPNWMITETQTYAPWCTRYALTAMMNTVEGNEISNAKDLLKKEYPNATEEQLLNTDYVTGGTMSEVIKVMQREYGYTLDMAIKPLDRNGVKEQIDKNAPIYVSLKPTYEGSDYKGHAIVLMGYIVPSNPSAESYYYFWNPWWNKVMLTNQQDISHWNLNSYVYNWAFSGINLRKEPLKVSENPVTVTEISKTMMVNNQSGTIKTLPTGRIGSEYINSSGKFAGWVVTATQETGTNLYCNELKGWVEKSALTEVISMSIPTKIVNSGFSIDYIPWQSGIQHIGYSKDHINQSVTIIARNGSYYFVPDLGWIDKKAFSVSTQSQVDAIKNSNTVTNTKWTIKNTENHLTVLNNGKSIDTLPWGKKGFNNLSNVNNHASQYIHITQDAGSYVYSPDLRGWVDKKGLNFK